jgi:hypothetical protein
VELGVEVVLEDEEAGDARNIDGYFNKIMVAVAPGSGHATVSRSHHRKAGTTYRCASNPLLRSRLLITWKQRMADKQAIFPSCATS